MSRRRGRFVHSAIQATSIVMSVCGDCARFVAASSSLDKLAIADTAHRCYVERPLPPAHEEAEPSPASDASRRRA